LSGFSLALRLLSFNELIDGYGFGDASIAFFTESANAAGEEPVVLSG
jgi:hypothetical protein